MSKRKKIFKTIEDNVSCPVARMQIEHYISKLLETNSNLTRSVEAEKQKRKGRKQRWNTIVLTSKHKVKG